MSQTRTTIQGSRIEQARKLNGYTQKQLAEKASINQSAIALYEKGKANPSDETIKLIAEATGFLPSFFELIPLKEFPKGSLSYRSARSVTAKEEDKAYYQAKLLYEHVYKMSSFFVLPPVQIPVLKEKPEISADITRAALGLAPDLPIGNLTNTLEKNGAIILPLPIFLKKIDAFSTWVEIGGNRPLIAESFGKPGDRLRFSLAHELGHIVMHYPPRTSVQTMEKEANDFASALLLPKCMIVNEITAPVTLETLGQLKIKTGVSMQAIIYRAKNLKIITDRQATYLFTQISSRGWKTKEPSNLDIKTEIPQLFRKMIEGLYDSPEKYATDMSLSNSRAYEMTLFS